MASIGDFIMLKDGTSIHGKVLTKEFNLKTKFGTLKLKKADILSAHYKNDTQFFADEVQLGAGTRLEGDLQPTILDISIEGLEQPVQINKSDIHTLVFFMSRKMPISAKGQKLTAKLKAASKLS